MDTTFVQTLFQRRATFARSNPKNPFSPDSLSQAVVVLTGEEASELRRLSYERETKELSEKRCSECGTGRIVEEKIPHLDGLGNKVHTMRYSCTCDGSEPIDPSNWVPIG